MIAYKILLNNKKEFVSPVSGRVWKNGEMSAPDVPARDPMVREHWVWACDRPDHEELIKYIDSRALLVELELYGEIIVNDNGVIQAEHAVIKGINVDSPLGVYLYVIFNRIDPSDHHRRIVSENPMISFMFARDYDGSHDITRAGSCKDPKTAYLYAKDVDKHPRSDTRKAACESPEFAYLYARFIDRCIREDTKNAAFKDVVFRSYYKEFIGNP